MPSETTATTFRSRTAHTHTQTHTHTCTESDDVTVKCSGLVTYKRHSSCTDDVITSHYTDNHDVTEYSGRPEQDVGATPVSVRVSC